VGRCHEQQGMPPYWPWVPANRAHTQTLDSETPKAEMGTGDAYCSEIIPELSQEPPESTSVDSPEHARFSLFDSLTSLLKNASEAQPIVIVLEDLHWADSSTLLLLEFIGQ
jgi:predicted ATPase